MNKSILVPIDFTQVTEDALKNALVISNKLKITIKLLNLVKNESSIAQAKASLNALAMKYSHAGLQIEAIVEQGDIKDIGLNAEKLGSGLIVMGTHGLKGVQYLTGSKAMKVVTHSSIPIIITQSAPTKESYEEIVVPIDFAQEEKQILTATSKVAAALGARIHLIGAGHSDEFLKEKVRLNISFAKRFLRDKNIEFITLIAPGKKDFQDEILSYSQMIDADLIAMLNHHEDGYKNLLGSNFDQNIITNNLKIPVLMFSGKNLADLRDIFMMFQ